MQATALTRLTAQIVRGALGSLPTLRALACLLPLRTITCGLPLRTLACLLPLLCLLPSCGDSAPDEPDFPVYDAEVPAGFYITVGDVAAPAATFGSRATPTDGTYHPGEGFENFIDLDNRDFRFYFFTSDENPTFISEMNVTSVIQVGSTLSTKTYKVLGSVMQSMLAEKDFRVVALANWRSYPEPVYGVTTIDELCVDANAIFEFDRQHSVISRETPIPLFGVRQCADVTYDAAYFYNLGTIHLLRAYAKVDIIIPRETDKRWSIMSAELTRCSARGLKAPAGVDDQDDYVKNSYDADYTLLPAIPDDEVIESLAFTRVNADSSVYRIYMPEFRNIDSNGNPLTDDARSRIRVRLTDRRTGWESYLGEQYIDFKYYVAPDNHSELKGKYFNVMRNYWYKFTISKGDEVSDLNVRIDVQPYASVDLDPTFGLERDPIDGYIVLKKNAHGDPTLYYDDEFENYYDFEKNQLISNYSDQIGRLVKPPFGLTGDIWLIKRANGETDGTGDDKAQMSLLYDGNTGVYYDKNGEPLNLKYLNDQSTTLDYVGPASRDFLYNNIVMSYDENSSPSSYYDFTDGKYKGASNPHDTDPATGLFNRIEIGRLTGGWIQIIPYWRNWDISTTGAHLYFNVYTGRYYDVDGYCLQSSYADHFEYYITEGVKEIILKADEQERPTLVYNREDGKYYSYVNGGNRTQVSRPAQFERDMRLNYTPWPQVPVTVTP